MIATDQPGTTRDSIFVPFERDGRELMLIDTAGVRRRARVSDDDRELQRRQGAAGHRGGARRDRLLDAHDGVAEQDASVLGLALRARPGAGDRHQQVGRHRRGPARGDPRRRSSCRLDFVPFAPGTSSRRGMAPASANCGARRVRAYDAAMRDMPTPQLTRVLEAGRRGAPAAAGARPAHQAALRAPGRAQPAASSSSTATRPSTCPSLPALPGERLPQGVPPAGHAGAHRAARRREPFAGRRNTLTPRQVKRRRRVRTIARAAKR